MQETIDDLKGTESEQSRALKSRHSEELEECKRKADIGILFACVLAVR